MGKRIDMTGQKFHNLTVIASAGNDPRGEMLWKCVCDCGRECIVCGSYLRTGHTKSCGCRIGYGHHLGGKRFGKLTAVSKLRMGEKQANVRTDGQWKCICDCGREKIVLAGDLIKKKVTTCGNCRFGRYEDCGEYVIGHFENNTYFYIDKADYELVSQFRWWDDGHGYFVTSDHAVHLFLHHLILPPKDGYICDHANRIRHDNRRMNLRYATRSQNMWNKSLQKNNTSGYIGVSWHKRYEKYAAFLEWRGRSINLGRYNTAEDAARVRDKAARRLFGDFAVLNFPDEVLANG